MILVEPKSKRPQKKINKGWRLWLHLIIDLLAIFLIALGEGTVIGYTGLGLLILSTVTLRSFSQRWIS